MAKPLSIEDLLKKASPTPATQSPNASIKNKTSAKTPTASSGTATLQKKMREIDLDDRERLAQEQARKLGLPWINLKGFPIAPEALSLIPKTEAEANKAICFLNLNNQARLGVIKPNADVDIIAKRISAEQKATVEIYLISDESFRVAFDLYSKLPEPKEIIFGYRVEEADLAKYEKEIGDLKQLQEKIGKVSTTDIITLVMGAALHANASDIHVEAEEEQVKVRFRIDGILQDAASLPRETWKAIIGRLKLLAGVKINIEDVPQDGRITIYLAKEKIDIRVSFLPTAFGESVVMRLLRPKAVALEFDNLGIRGLALERLTREIDRPNGMIITTGPTGSGKTTTLYAILKKLNNPEIKIITLEDPVEYKLEGINQSPIDHAKNYDFARGLRSILRQDPDVVMVGEIRDTETAEIAIQAALTGHLVVSTIHTNSAAGAVPRFLSMGVKPFLLAPALNAVIGQRLVRRLCPTCRTNAELSPSQKKETEKILGALPTNSGYTVDLSKLAFKSAGKGCDACHNGYKGRVGIYEIFTMTKEIETAIVSKEVSESDIAAFAMKNGMITMAQDGLLKALDGLTSVDEVLSVANIDSTLIES